VRYKLGDYINIYNEKTHDEYADYCINFTILHNDLKLGDKIWLIQNGSISEVEFLDFAKCEWAKKNSKIICCKTCNGYLQIKNSIGGVKTHCAGYTHKRNSNIYKITKGVILLEDKLFEI
jgi:hypothetical protein